MGCGAMSRAWFSAAAEIDDLEIVGLVDLDLERARSRAAEFGLAHAEIGTDLDALLNRLKPDLLFDVVVPGARREVALAGFAHGCHVLSEKPMADSMAAARDMAAAAKAAGRVHAIIQNRRYLAGIRRIRRLVESGAIGDLTGVHCDFFVGPHFGGFREEMEHVLLLDMAIHTFDAARLVAGRRPVAVYCHESNPAGSWYAHGASAHAIFELEGGGVLTYRGSWCAEGLRTSWESAWRLTGTCGSLSWDGAEDFRAEVATDRRDGLFFAPEAIEVPPLDPADRVGGHLGVMRDFVDAIRAGTEPETVGHQNIHSLAMVFAAIDSARQGRRVAIPTTEES
ncbi:Gfo/Idh/MocA family protein [Inquilinus sp. 2KB_12]|uniref:Gfo/Idh/MocA family protein n=1 Tax=Inquilinus sp. 2KB_12 TaxID=3232975 RepID=UPI003F91E43E